MLVFRRSLHGKSVPKLLECYEALGLERGCTRDTLKDRYISLAKRFHPDSAGAEANASQFGIVQSAYRTILQLDWTLQDRQQLEKLPPQFEIQHTSPQHRQYLEYGGVGSGTPGQRMRQYQQDRANKASEHVHDYMVQQLVHSKDDGALTATSDEAAYARRWKTRNAMDRMVEDLIQESMRNGEFDKLPGKGKPLPGGHRNPFLDATTQKINEILAHSGYCPVWVSLEKQVREELRSIRAELAQFCLNERHVDKRSQESRLASVRERVGSLNKSIDRLNLQVPSLSRQMVRVSADAELTKARRLVCEMPPTCDTSAVNCSDSCTAISATSSKPVGVFRTLIDAFHMKVS